jgi:hypothetical protein
MSTINPSEIPPLPIDISTTAGFNEVYILYKLLEDLKPGYGAAYLADAYDPFSQISLNVYFEVVLPEFYGGLQTLMDSVANILADVIQAKDGKFLPTVIDAIAYELKKHSPSFINPLSDPVVTELQKELKQALKDHALFFPPVQTGANADHGKSNLYGSPGPSLPAANLTAPHKFVQAMTAFGARIDALQATITRTQTPAAIALATPAHS